MNPYWSSSFQADTLYLTDGHSGTGTGLVVVVVVVVP